jgi:hypothetical protein
MMLLMDLENPVDVKLKKPSLQSSTLTIERVDHAPGVPVADHSASDLEELVVVGAEIRSGGAGGRTGGAVGVVGRVEVRIRST